MRILLLYIIMLMHANTMLIPIMNGTEKLDAKGRPHDEINSVAEYVYQVMLNHKDKTPEDEDGEHDQSAFFSNHKGQVVASLFEIKIPEPLPVNFRKAMYFPLEVNKIPVVSFEVSVPPPDSLFV